MKADSKRIPQCAMKMARIEGVVRVYSVWGEAQAQDIGAN
jgi:hypothetical protein